METKISTEPAGIFAETVEPLENCFKCTKSNVCKVRDGMNELLLKSHFMDYDKPYGAQWFTSLFYLVASRCREFEEKTKEPTAPSFMDALANKLKAEF